MKVKELYIKNYHQFEDFKLDLTYPAGHEKAGLPLDKVCFIGQSGTGKTSLLEMIHNFIKYSFYLNTIPDDSLQIGENDRMPNLSNLEFHIHKEVRVVAEISKESIAFNPLSKKALIHRSNKNIFSEGVFPDSLISFFFPVDFTSNTGKSDSSNSVESKNLFLNFGGTSYSEIWQKINDQIVKFREYQIQFSLNISEIAKQIGVKSEDILEATKKYQEWEQSNPNPLQDLADKVLDKILNKFNLRVRTRLDFEKIEDVKAIKIETLDGQEVPYDFQSTGTRQVLLSMLPLYTLKPNRTAIFFDEPERSLYPDIQKEIVDIYTSLTTDCQFFYATHSPIIASSFEPWEIVELKFNPKTGKVYQELYYEGERHVDNYTINPQYLRWDDILGRLFDLEDEGNPKRTKALMRLAILESKLKKNHITPEEKETLWDEYAKLSKLTGWTTRMTNEKN